MSKFDINRETAKLIVQAVNSDDFEIIEAWAAGKKIQWRFTENFMKTVGRGSTYGSDWMDIESTDKEVQFGCKDYMWRVKPAPKKVTIQHWVVVNFTLEKTYIRSDKKKAVGLHNNFKKMGQKSIIKEINEEVTHVPE